MAVNPTRARIGAHLLRYRSLLCKLQLGAETLNHPLSKMAATTGSAQASPPALSSPAFEGLDAFMWSD